MSMIHKTYWLSAWAASEMDTKGKGLERQLIGQCGSRDTSYSSGTGVFHSSSIRQSSEDLMS
jgi:hypothetical protein